VRNNDDSLAAVAKGFDRTLPDVGVRVIGQRPIDKAHTIMGGDRAEQVQKAALIGEPDTSTGSNQVSRDDYATAFTQLGAIDPVYDPEMLALLFEHSNSLRQNVDSYGVNIDGFGHRFDPLFNLDDPAIDQRIGDAMFTDRERAVAEAADGLDAPEPAYPTAEEIKAKKAEIARLMRLEKIRLTHFFEFCSPSTSFVTLRRRTRQDLEVTGNAYWEVLRNRADQIVQFVYMPSFSMRLLPLDMSTVLIQNRIRVSELSFDTVEHNVRMRRVAQVVEGRAVFFKELGDPRLISSESGAVYDDLDSMRRNEPASRPANEIIHFKIFSPRSPYGVPRWIGNLLGVVGSRQAEEVNFNYFENKSVPPLAILVSGGRMTSESVDRVSDYIEANIKGKRNFHKILVLEAEGPGGDPNGANASKMKIDIRPLTGAQHSDALFQVYDERNIDKVGQSFRLPRMLRGDIRDFNKSTAESALTFAEMQVFEPERQEFDFLINRMILSRIGVRFWKFQSLAPVMRDPVAMSEIVKNLMNANVLLPSEARELAGDVFNRQFKRIKAPWAHQPLALTIAGVPFVPEPSEGEPTGPHTEAPNWDRDGGAMPDKPEGEGIEARLPSLPSGTRKRLRGEVAKLLQIRKLLQLTEHAEWHDHLARQAAAGE
jgi:PBSX family phage portal protein